MVHNHQLYMVEVLAVGTSPVGRPVTLAEWRGGTNELGVTLNSRGNLTTRNIKSLSKEVSSVFVKEECMFISKQTEICLSNGEI